MNDDEKYRVLAQYRLEQADETLKEASALYQASYLSGATNRAYYAMFYAIQALMVKSDVFTSKHRGVISWFDMEFVKTGKIGRDFSQWLHDAFALRLDADYGERKKVTPESAQATIQHAEQFIQEVRKAVDSYLAGA